MSDIELANTLTLIADALPESDLISRLRLNSLLAEVVRLKAMALENRSEPMIPDFSLFTGLRLVKS